MRQIVMLDSNALWVACHTFGVLVARNLDDQKDYLPVLPEVKKI
jgi:hypothetical protein